MTDQNMGRRPWTTAATAGGRLAAVAAVALLATGCGTTGDPVDPVKERWKSRTAHSSCGKVRLRQGETMQQQAAREIACLRRALENGAGSELHVTRPTVEGDPIHEHYRLTPQGRLEVYTDSTADRFSDRTWSYAECHSPQWLPEISCPKEP